MTNQERILINKIRVEARDIGRQVLPNSQYNVVTETALSHVAELLEHLVQRIDQIDANNGNYRPGAFLNPKSP